MFFKHEGITGVTNAAVKEVRPREILLTDGRTLPFSFAMLAPAFLGAGSPGVRPQAPLDCGGPAGYRR